MPGNRRIWGFRSQTGAAKPELTISVIRSEATRDRLAAQPARVSPDVGRVTEPGGSPGPLQGDRAGIPVTPGRVSAGRRHRRLDGRARAGHGAMLGCLVRRECRAVPAGDPAAAAGEATRTCPGVPCPAGRRSCRLCGRVARPTYTRL